MRLNLCFNLILAWKRLGAQTRTNLRMPGCAQARTLARQ